MTTLSAGIPSNGYLILSSEMWALYLMTLGWENHPLKALDFEKTSSGMLMLQACTLPQRLLSHQYFFELETYVSSP